MSKKGERRRRRLERTFKEQNGLCWICQMPMRLNLSKGYRSKRSKYDASLDHIIPVSKGGTIINSKAAHGYCNSARGAEEIDRDLNRHIKHMQNLLSCHRRLKMLGLEQ